MYTKKQKSQPNSLQNASGWDEAIAFAKARIKELTKVVEGFKAAKKRGDVWPNTVEN